jgi:hypothetical protein
MRDKAERLDHADQASARRISTPSCKRVLQRHGGLGRPKPHYVAEYYREYLTNYLPYRHLASQSRMAGQSVC